MTIDFEKFGRGPYYVDDRWVVERLGSLGLSIVTDTFMNTATRRVYDSERIAHELGVGGPPIGDDEWNLLQFTFAFAAEAQADPDPARLQLSLQLPKSTDRFKVSKLHLSTQSGTSTHEEEPFTMSADDDTPFFRAMVTYYEAAFGVADVDLTMPDDEWQPQEAAVNGWKLVKTLDPAALTFSIEKVPE